MVLLNLPENEEKTTPKNRDEQEIAGYRDVLNIIHESFDAIPITQNYILQLHKILYSHMNNPMAGRTKSVQNYISATYPDGHVETLFTPLAPYDTPEALNRICEEYNRVIGNMEVEPLIALETVRRATLNKIGRFTKQDIRELCPSLSISSIESALRKLVASEDNNSKVKHLFGGAFLLIKFRKERDSYEYFKWFI